MLILSCIRTHGAGTILTPEVIDFYDTFTKASAGNTTLASWTGMEVGTSWTLRTDTTGGRLPAVIGSGAGYATPSLFSLGDQFTYTAQPGPSSSEFNVTVNVQKTSALATDRPFWILFRWTATTDYYAVGFFENGASPDARLFKRVASVNTSLATATLGLDWIGSPHTVLIEARTNSQKVYVDGSLALSATDSALASAGEVGLGQGDLFNTNDDTSDWKFLDIKVVPI